MIAPVDGPVYYSMVLGNDIKLFATTTQGEGEGRSAEWDRKAHIWASQDGTRWEDLISWEKDLWPYRLLGYGRIDFAHGEYETDVYFTAHSLKGIDGMLIQAKIVV